MEIEQCRESFLDGSFSLTADQAGSLLLLNGLARGNDVKQRIGRQIFMRSLIVRGRWYASAASGVDQAHRVIVFYDKQSNGVAPVPADVLQNVSCFSELSWENRARFEILSDDLFAVNGTGEAQSHVVRTYRVELNRPVYFNAGNTGTVADISTGALYLLVIGTHNTPSFGAGIGRYWLRYTDA